MPVACTNKTRSKSAKKNEATLEFYQRDGPVKIRKKVGDLILFFTFATHALCELPCSSLWLTSQPLKHRYHHLCVGRGNGTTSSSVNSHRGFSSRLTSSARRVTRLCQGETSPGHLPCRGDMLLQPEGLCPSTAHGSQPTTTQPAAREQLHALTANRPLSRALPRDSSLLTHFGIPPWLY